MCGIIGCISESEAAKLGIDGLKRLEYRGYDSAGIAMAEGGKVNIIKDKGRISALESRLVGHRCDIAILHTRWATHGEPNGANAHPHPDCKGKIAVVHNGIIENHTALRKMLETEGHVFRSETDTEVIAHLLEKFYSGSITESMRETVTLLEGAYAIAAIAEGEQPEAIRNVLRGRVSGEGVKISIDDLRSVKRVVITACGTNWHSALIGKYLIEGIAGVPVEVDYASEFRYRGLIVCPDDLIVAISQSGETADTLADIEKISSEFAGHRNFLYLGRGINYPVALEGALKLKEISYIHAEGYPAAEMKHGPIALIDRDMPVLFIATENGSFSKILNNMEEFHARGGRIIAVANEPAPEQLRRLAEHVIYVPKTIDELSPIVNVVPLQLLAYHITDIKGLDVDYPRNLSKCVSVE